MSSAAKPALEMLVAGKRLARGRFTARNLLGATVDLIDLDASTPFVRYLREEHELVRVG